MFHRLPKKIICTDLNSVENARGEDVHSRVDLVAHVLLRLLDEPVNLPGGLVVHDYAVLARFVDASNHDSSLAAVRLVVVNLK